MNFDYEPGGDDQELMKIWQRNLVAADMDYAQIVQDMSSKMKKFDRTIWWRNFSEYAAGGLLIAFFSWRLFDSALRLLSVAGIFAVGFVMTYLWWSHRQATPLDPAADALSYRAALLDRYDRQIRLLSGVKYWYVLPLYSWTLLSIVMTVPPQNVKRRIGAGLVSTALCAFVVWLNEVRAVKKLRVERMRAEALLEEGKD